MRLASVGKTSIHSIRITYRQSRMRSTSGHEMGFKLNGGQETHRYVECIRLLFRTGSTSGLKKGTGRRNLHSTDTLKTFSRTQSISGHKEGTKEGQRG